MNLSFVTLFPELCHASMQTGVLGRGVQKGIISVEAINPRDFTDSNYGSVDDTPYGGGPGMVMSAEPLVKAVESIEPKGTCRRVLLTPTGAPFNQKKAREYSELDHLVFICGRYEGMDERVKLCLEPEEISLGDFVMTGGELAALSIADASCRLIEGVLGSHSSTVSESFSEEEIRLEYPQFTKPREFRGLTVPEVLLSGNHKAIAAWRNEQADAITQERRPDLFARGCAS